MFVELPGILAVVRVANELQLMPLALAAPRNVKNSTCNWISTRKDISPQSASSVKREKPENIIVILLKHARQLFCIQLAPVD
jgi:hypothetical protein